MVRLVRSNAGFPQRHKGVRAGGRFFALDEVNDLYPDIDAELDLKEFLQNGGECWIQNAEKADGWKPIFSTTDIEKIGFHMEYSDDYEACTLRVHFIPFEPEFYLLGTNEVTQQMIEKCCRPQHK